MESNIRSDELIESYDKNDDWTHEIQCQDILIRKANNGPD